MDSEPFAGRDPRVRVIGDQQTFERIEPTLRRSLLVVALLALAIGIAHHWSLTRSQPAGDANGSAAVQRAGTFLPPGP